jgi:hypothetical protein
LSNIDVYVLFFYKVDYTEMAKKLDSDWKTTLSEKDPDTSFELFHKAFERAKEKCIPKCSSKAGTKAKNTTTYH